MGEKIDKLALVYLRDKKILCVRSKGKDLYYLPGGKREDGESDVEALTREIKEELDVGLVEQSLRYMGVFEAQAHGKPAGTIVRTTCYSGDFIGKPKPSSEVEELAWLGYLDKAKATLSGCLVLDFLKERDLLGDGNSEPDDEFIDEVDPKGNIIATHPKSYLNERMFLHRVSLIIPMTSSGHILLSRRAKEKLPFPDTWVCAVGGKVRSGEADEEAAIREMEEEIGRTYPLRKVSSFVYDGREYKALFTIFTTTVPVFIKDLKLDPTEIEYSKEFAVEEVMEMVRANPNEFAPTFIVAIKEFAGHCH